MAMRQPGPGLPLGLGQALGCSSTIGVCNPAIACPAPSQDGLNPQNCPDLSGAAGSCCLVPAGSYDTCPSAFSLGLRGDSPQMTLHSRMSTGRLLEQNQKHVCAGKQDRDLGKGDVCSAGVTEEKHIEETSQMLLMLKCHNPGRARLLGKNSRSSKLQRWDFPSF